MHNTFANVNVVSVYGNSVTIEARESFWKSNHYKMKAHIFIKFQKLSELE